MKNFKDYLNIIQESDMDLSNVPPLFRKDVQRLDNSKKTGEGGFSSFNLMIEQDNIIIKSSKGTDEMFLFQGPKDAENNQLITQIKKIIKTSPTKDLFLNYKHEINEAEASALVEALNKKGIAGELKSKSFEAFGKKFEYWAM